MRIRKISQIAGLSFALSGLAGAAPYTTTLLPFQSTGINNSGQVVGTLITANGPAATLWSGTAATNFGTASAAYGINDAGQIVGSAEFGDGFQRAFVWNGALATELPSLGGRYSSASSINNAGQVVGFSYTASNNPHATLWNGTTATDLGSFGGRDSYAVDINNASQVVGFSLTAGNIASAIIWNGTTASYLGTPVGSTHSQAWSINDNGQVVGNADTTAIIWNGTTATELSKFAGAMAINNSSQVVGYSYTISDDSDIVLRATLWNGTTATDLNTYLDVSLAAAGWSLYQANGINDAGSIVGYARNANTNEVRGFLIHAVPEPQTNALVLVGLGVMAGVARRRRSKQQ